ncbi:MAG: hypothetical protein ANABAC_0114 [Anaerolineae bacterium]|nr:MAG: hypothetical protein ANABAC_0114 [Anaerolineae bacterium]
MSIKIRFLTLMLIHDTCPGEIWRKGNSTVRIILLSALNPLSLYQVENIGGETAKS